MRLQLGDGPEYSVEGEVLDLLVLHYGQMIFEQYNKLDPAVQFAMKLVTKPMISQVLKTFGVQGKLPRGTDPNEFLLRTYILLMRESLEITKAHLVVDEEAHTIVDGSLDHQDDDVKLFGSRMNVLLEGLKDGALLSPERAGLLPPGTNRTGSELAASGEEEEWEDNRGEDTAPGVVSAVS